MKVNRYQEVRAAGSVAVGHMLLEFATRGVAQMLDAANLDFVLLDMEHTALSLGDVANVIAWLKATSVAPFVRVPSEDAHFIARALDAGALGVMVPNVTSAEMAARVVRAAKYAPQGTRGVLLAGAGTNFRSVDAAEFTLRANAATTVICQIESREGVRQAQAIAATPGVDVLLVGPGDLAHDLGIPGQVNHPDFQAALRKVVAAAKAHGRAAGLFVTTSDAARSCLELGYDFIAYSADFLVYQAALTSAVRTVRDLAAKGNPEPS